MLQSNPAKANKSLSGGPEEMNAWHDPEASGCLLGGRQPIYLLAKEINKTVCRVYKFISIKLNFFKPTSQIEPLFLS